MRPSATCTLPLVAIAALTGCTSPESYPEPRASARADVRSETRLQQREARPVDSPASRANATRTTDPATSLAETNAPADQSDAGTKNVTSWTESAEAKLDVIVAFRGEAWDRVVREAQTGDATWARRRVIEQLQKYHDDPPSYFASEPAFLAQSVPFETRIEWEVIGHVRENDSEIRFSRWFGAKRYWVQQERD